MPTLLRRPKLLPKSSFIAYRPWRNGQAELGWVASYIQRRQNRRTIDHPSRY